MGIGRWGHRCDSRKGVGFFLARACSKHNWRLIGKRLGNSELNARLEARFYRRSQFDFPFWLPYFPCGYRHFSSVLSRCNSCPKKTSENAEPSSAQRRDSPGEKTIECFYRISGPFECFHFRVFGTRLAWLLYVALIRMGSGQSNGSRAQIENVPPLPAKNIEQENAVPEVDSRLPYNFRDLYTLKNYWKTVRRNEKDCAKSIFAKYVFLQTYNFLQLWS